jgi:hypothetical protein
MLLSKKIPQKALTQVSSEFNLANQCEVDVARAFILQRFVRQGHVRLDAF